MYSTPGLLLWIHQDPPLSQPINLSASTCSMWSPSFVQSVPVHRFATQNAVTRRRPVRACNRPNVKLCMADAGAQEEEVTCGDAIREWIIARDRGETARESPDARASCAAGRVGVLFVGKDNTTVSAAAEAIFTDICERRALDCFSCHSAGTSARHGEPPDKTFVEALRFKRGLDMSRKMSCSLDRNDLESYSLVVCMDEHTRSQLLYMGADEQGRFNDSEEEKVVVLSTYCSVPKLQAMQFLSGQYPPDQMNFLVSALIDACNGLLVSLIESPPMPKS